MTNAIIPLESLEKKIYTIRGVRVMLGSDLAMLYGVSTTRLNEQVSRNRQRFPDTFAFQFTQEEKEEVIAKCDNPDKLRFSPSLPRGFTERGVLMLSNVLKSDRAIEVSIQIIEAFVRLRQMVLSLPDISKKLEEIEARLAGHDLEFKHFHELILPLLAVNNPPRRKAGFNPGGKK